MKNLTDTIAEISEGITWLDNLYDKTPFGWGGLYGNISDEDMAALEKLHIKGLRFFKKSQVFTGVTDADL